jgi:hypothetical protein
VNSRTSAEVAFGVAGIWLIVSRIPDALLTLVAMQSDPNAQLRWLGGIHFGIAILCGLGLIVLRFRLASWLVPRADGELTGSVPGLQAAAFSVVGLLLLSRGFADLLGRLVLAAATTEDRSFWRFALPLVQVTVGLAVFLGAPVLVSLWRAVGSRRSDGTGERG